MLRIILMSFITSCLLSCAANPLKVTSDLQQGKRYFETGYYKRAMHVLLPLACDGNAQAQYSVGYMYYYGYGTTQDIDTGYFWIKRSADQHFPPACEALLLIERSPEKNFYASYFK